MSFDFLIFDLDGTLIDSQRDITSAVNSVIEKYGFEHLSVEQVRFCLGSGVDTLMDKAVLEKIEKKGIIKKEMVKSELLGVFVKLFNSYYEKCLTDTTVVYSGIIEMLEALKNKRKAILSNKSECFSREIVKRLKISDYFIEIWGGDSVKGTRKPDSKPITDLIKLTNSDVSKSIMIGDSVNDFLAAKAAGIPSVAVLYGYSDIEQLKQCNPDFIAKTPQDIIDIVI